MLFFAFIESFLNFYTVKQKQNKDGNEPENKVWEVWIERKSETSTSEFINNDTNQKGHNYHNS